MNVSLTPELESLIRDNGGIAETGAHVDSVEVANGRALGVRCKGSLVRARRAVPRPVRNEA